MAECGKGWSRRCAAAKSKKCRCRCGGENHGAARKEPDGRTTDDDLYYGYEEKRHRQLNPSHHEIAEIHFSREAHDERQRGRALVEIVYHNRAGTWPVRQRYVRHSPDGFEFGYGGSGPADCALNLLALFIPVKEATFGGLYQDFKDRFVARIDQEKGGTVDAADVRAFIVERWNVEETKTPEVAAVGA
jgi:hypothetical protein